MNTFVEMHDVAITNVAPSSFEVYSTWTVPLEINVTVKNNGTVTETDFPLTLYWNTSAIDTKMVTLKPQENKTLAFIWNVPDIPFAYPYPTYILSANAPLPNDNNTVDNTFIDSTITIKWPGDADGDGYIFVYDLFFFGKAWGSKRGGPRYNQQVDFDGNGQIFIYDLYLLGKNWGKKLTE